MSFAGQPARRRSPVRAPVLNSPVLMSSAPTGSARRVIRFGVFELDIRAGELRKNGVRIRLQDQPLQLLVTLLERPGDVLTRDELRQKLWPADTFVDFDHSLNSISTHVVSSKTL